MKKLINLLVATLFISSCAMDEDRFETIDKLRAIGTAPNPVLSAPSTATAPAAATLTFYAAVPLGDTVTAEAYTDPQANFGLAIPISVVEGSETYTDLAGFRLYTVNATMVIPSAELLPEALQAGFFRLRYGIRLTSGDEEELIVGDYIVYPEGSAQLAWQPPVVAIELPGDEPVSTGEVDIAAPVSNPNGERVRLSWFVSEGLVTNRRANNTTWEIDDAGTHTVLVTVRGLDSGGFNLVYKDVVVQ